jgi:hypothetical protein
MYNGLLRTWSIVLLPLVMSGLALPASADRLLEKPTIGPRLKLSAKVKANFNDYSNDAAFQLNELTMGLLDMRFDLQSKRARLNLGGGDPEVLRLRVDSNVLIGKGRARIQARLDLAIAGHRWAVEVPEFDLDTESVAGERAVMLSLPLVEGKF